MSHSGENGNIFSKKPTSAATDYTARSVQLRLLMLVFAFGTVLVLMTKARDPAMYAWMGFDNQAAEPPAQSTDSAGTIDTLVPLSPATDPPAGAVHIDKGFVSRFRDIDSTSDARARMLEDRWQRLTGSLSRDERMHFAAVLRALRRGEPIAATDQAAMSVLVEQFNQQWLEQDKQARERLNADQQQIPPEQSTRLTTLLDELLLQWQQQWKPALSAIVTDPVATETTRQALGKIDRVLDRLAMSRIEDNRVLLPAEYDAWFRLLDQLNQADPQTLATTTLPSVNYLQLNKQPAEYRGRLIKIRGTAKRIHYVRAPRNAYQIDGYYITWMRIAGGANLPIAVYSLEPPASLPVTKIMSPDHTTVDDQVQLTGYFFKKHLYRAADGLNTAPLVLARQIDLVRHQTGAGEGDPFAFGSVVSTLVLCCAVVWIAYRVRSVWPQAPAAQRSKESLDVGRISDGDIAPPLADRLARLAEQDEGE